MPLLWLSLAFLGGVLLGDLLGWPQTIWLVLAGSGVAVQLLRGLPVLAFKLAKPIHPLLSKFSGSPISYPILLACLCLGAARYQAVQEVISPGHVAWYNGKEAPYVVEGVIEAYPDTRDAYVNLRVRAIRLHADEDLQFIPVEGSLLAKAPPGGDYHYGDQVRLRGWLRTPSENEEFSYRNYLERQGIQTVLYCTRPDGCVVHLGSGQGNPFFAVIFAFRERAYEAVNRLFPEPESSLLAGILLGLDGGISEEVYQAFRDTGTAHIIAISGFNIAIIAGLFASLFGRWLGRWRGMLACFIGIGSYAILAGASASVNRAALMGSISILGVQLGRRQNGLNSLGFVAALMALQDPNVLWDVGFQLSFTATLGLVLYAGPLTEWFRKAAGRYLTEQHVQRLTGPVSEYLLFTLAAQLTTLPLTVYHFRRLSLVSVIANPLILPAQPPLMILGGLAVLAGMVSLPLGQAAAYLAWPFVAYTIRMAEWLARLDIGVFYLGNTSLALVVGFYTILLVITFYGARLRAWAQDHIPRLPSRAVWLGAVALGLISFVIWQAALSAPDGRLHLTVLDVGGGDAILIQTPTGRTILVDGGPSASQLSNGLGRRLPLTHREIDYLVVAGVSDEQLGGLPRALERYPAAKVLWSGSAAGSYSARDLRLFLGRSNIPVILAQPGQRLDLGEGVVLHVLSVNRRGAILLLEWKSFSALLPISVDFESMDSLMHDPRLGPVTALLLADSGYAPINTTEWIGRWRPQVVLLSVAGDDPDGRPDPETLEAIGGYSLLRTDLNGWIELSTDGEQMWVEVERR